MNRQYLILVDKEDNVVGKMEKLQVHQQGLLHRAFSIFVFNSKGELLLQQRADYKYHSGGLWSNTCCSHPNYGEKIEMAAKRRLKEEMGIDCELKFKFKFIYRTAFENGLKEHELDHVYFGTTDQLPCADKTEVKSWKYVNIKELEKDIKQTPEEYTEWLKICFPEVKSQLKLY